MCSEIASVTAIRSRTLAGQRVRCLRAMEDHTGRGGMHQLMQQDLFFCADLPVTSAR